MVAPPYGPRLGGRRGHCRSAPPAAAVPVGNGLEAPAARLDVPGGHAVQPVDVDGLRAAAGAEAGLLPQARHAGHRVRPYLGRVHRRARRVPAAGPAATGLAATLDELPLVVRIPGVAAPTSPGPRSARRSSCARRGASTRTTSTPTRAGPRPGRWAAERRRPADGGRRVVSTTSTTRPPWRLRSALALLARALLHVHGAADEAELLAQPALDEPEVRRLELAAA